jgi:hypothetical protein
MWCYRIAGKPYAFAVTSANAIIVGEDFDLLSFPVKEFILAHELGHHKLAHVATTGKSPLQVSIERSLGAQVGKFADEEIEADRYAVSLIGKTMVMQGMEEVKLLMSDPLISIELDYRINKVREIDEVHMG